MNQQIPKVTILSVNVGVSEEKLDYHRKCMSQDYPNYDVEEIKQEEISDAIRRHSDSHLFWRVNNCQFFQPNTLSVFVKKILTTPNTGVVYSDSIFVQDKRGMYTPRLAYSRENLINFPGDFSGNFLFAVALGLQIPYRSSYDFLLRASERCVFGHIPKGMIYTEMDVANPQELISIRDAYLHEKRS
jgi:hypothetical protein